MQKNHTYLPLLDLSSQSFFVSGKKNLKNKHDSSTVESTGFVPPQLSHKSWCRIRKNKSCNCRRNDHLGASKQVVRIECTTNRLMPLVDLVVDAQLTGMTNLACDILECLLPQRDLPERARDLALVYPVLKTLWNRNTGEKTYVQTTDDDIKQFFDSRIKEFQQLAKQLERMKKQKEENSADHNSNKVARKNELTRANTETAKSTKELKDGIDQNVGESNENITLLSSIQINQTYHEIPKPDEILSEDDNLANDDVNQPDVNVNLVYGDEYQVDDPSEESNNNLELADNTLKQSITDMGPNQVGDQIEESTNREGNVANENTDQDKQVVEENINISDSQSVKLNAIVNQGDNYEGISQENMELADGQRTQAEAIDDISQSNSEIKKLADKVNQSEENIKKVDDIDKNSHDKIPQAQYTQKDSDDQSKSIPSSISTSPKEKAGAMKIKENPRINSTPKLRSRSVFFKTFQEVKKVIEIIDSEKKKIHFGIELLPPRELLVEEVYESNEPVVKKEKTRTGLVPTIASSSKRICSRPCFPSQNIYRHRKEIPQTDNLFK